MAKLMTHAMTHHHWVDAVLDAVFHVATHIFC